MLKGIFTNPMPYTPLIENGDSSLYFGTYEGQRIGGFETSTCWDFSGAECVETRLTMLRALNLIPADTLKWLQNNGYIDSDGDFYVSRRWIAILSGVKNNGNSQLAFWKLVNEYGVIPNSLLPYSPTEAQKWLTQGQFNNDYFNPGVTTAPMYNVGKEFLKRFSVMAENLPGGLIGQIQVNLQTYLKEGSIQIGIPVPQDYSWNQPKVEYPKGRLIADHAVELYKFDPADSYPFFIYDSYNPNLKQLSRNYYLPFITRISIKEKVETPIIPQLPVSPWSRFWLNLISYFQGEKLPYPSVPLGGS